MVCFYKELQAGYFLINEDVQIFKIYKYHKTGIRERILLRS